MKNRTEAIVGNQNIRAGEVVTFSTRGFLRPFRDTDRCAYGVASQDLIRGRRVVVEKEHYWRDPLMVDPIPGKISQTPDQALCGTGHPSPKSTEIRRYQESPGETYEPHLHPHPNCRSKIDINFGENIKPEHFNELVPELNDGDEVLVEGVRGVFRLPHPGKSYSSDVVGEVLKLKKKVTCAFSGWVRIHHNDVCQPIITGFFSSEESANGGNCDAVKKISIQYEVLK